MYFGLAYKTGQLLWLFILVLRIVLLEDLFCIVLDTLNYM